MSVTARRKKGPHRFGAGLASLYAFCCAERRHFVFPAAVHGKTLHRKAFEEPRRRPVFSHTARSGAPSRKKIPRPGSGPPRRKTRNFRQRNCAEWNTGEKQAWRFDGTLHILIRYYVNHCNRLSKSSGRRRTNIETVSTSFSCDAPLFCAKLVKQCSQA